MTLYAKQQSLLLPLVINMVKDLKKEIENENLIPTADEIVDRLEVALESARLVANDKTSENY